MRGVRGFSSSSSSSRKKAELIERILRVDHAGEYGAGRIYAGQLRVLQGGSEDAVLKEMAEQEEAHLRTMQKLVLERRARPSLLTPLWGVAGYALGALTALAGKEAAMACTVAVETVTRCFGRGFFVTAHRRLEITTITSCES